ncbi:hypothetical protein CKM354_000423000 [Cercospora kikuchii]|uniref:Uncharacterized protein n=1 Tax=Cercospora kikuchii TaxID=84275 RepID=A0A9P3CI81_9PEZI|nr:uncharacterized protein CKM354_000423000 [Cercospora kikuchii]GIZ40910.1 hypothetical protein CKM354_000423000 [Cercospora kikuchii]
MPPEHQFPTKIRPKTKYGPEEGRRKSMSLQLQRRPVIFRYSYRSFQEVTLPNSLQFPLKSQSGQEYLIQISWPLHWQDASAPIDKPIPVIYIVDGNALFLTATETAWRRATSPRFADGGIVVAVGYPLEPAKLYDFQRRSRDLTPPTTLPIEGFGGADRFLEFLEGPVKSTVREKFPKIVIGREALYGHSYGGLFALYALFTRPHSFECFMASSPSIWWNDRCILDYANNFLAEEQAHVPAVLPSLMMFCGGWEQNPPRWDNEPLSDYEARQRMWNDIRMEDNMLDLCKMLEDCKRLHTTQKSVYEQEEHTSVMSCSPSRSITRFFEEWPLQSS